MFGFLEFIEIIRSILLIISAIFIVIAAIGILRIDKDQKNGVYAKIQILGAVDMAGVLAMLALDQIFLAAIYFVLAPVVAHAMANAYYYGEDTENSKLLNSKLLNKSTFNNDSENLSTNNNDEEKYSNENLVETNIIGNKDDDYTISTIKVNDINVNDEDRIKEDNSDIGISSERNSPEKMALEKIR